MTDELELTEDQADALQRLCRNELAQQGILFSAATGEEYELRGDNKEMVSSTEHEVVVAGPRDTGKTVTKNDHPVKFRALSPLTC